MKKFYTLNNDIIFKNTFDNEKNLKRLIEETLNIKVYEIQKNNIELTVDNIKERRKYLDLILQTDKGIINIEINHGYKDEMPNRNFLYLCKLISASIKKKKSYINIGKHIQLNITWNLSKYFNYDISKRKIIYSHLSDDKTHQKIHDDIFEIVHINMDYFKDVWYHGDIKKENPFLMLLSASTEEEMDKVCEGDKTMEEINDKVKKLNDDSDVLDVIIENEDEIIANSMYESGMQKGMEKGMEKGIEKGIEEGIEKSNHTIVNNMIKKGLSIDEISDLTGLSIDEIKKSSK